MIYTSIIDRDTKDAKQQETRYPMRSEFTEWILNRIKITWLVVVRCQVYQ